MDKTSKGYALVVLAGMLWATTGLFANKLMEYGLSPEQVAFIRLFLGFVILFLYSIIKDSSLLKINKKVFIHCLLIGIVSQAGFNLFYFRAIEKTGVSVAAVLLYTSPLFLAVLSKLVYKEVMDKNKYISLSVCFIGAVLAITSGNLDISAISSIGIILGILSAITYACMPIISKGILLECQGITILIYGFLIGSIFMIPLAKPVEILTYVSKIEVLPYMLGLGMISAAGAYICYMEGISKQIDLSIAGILASGELVGSVIIGWVILGEDFTIIKLIGMLMMILSGVLAINKSKNIDTIDSGEESFPT